MAHLPRIMRSFLMALLVVVLAACGGGAVVGTDPAGAEPAAPPETTKPVVADCPNFVTEVDSGEPIRSSEAGRLGSEQTRLDADLERAKDYAADHVDEFGLVRFENSPRVRIVIGFTENLDEHCAALRELLTYADDFELVQTRATEAGLRDIQSEVHQLARGYLKTVGSGSGSGTVPIRLRADGEQVASEIVDRYGDLVEVTVGLLSYPDRTLDESVSCDGFVPPPPTEDLPLVASLELTDSDVSAGADFVGVATVTNAGEGLVEIRSGSPLTALVYRRGSSDVVGVYVGAIGGVGREADLATGESIEIEVLGGTASCEPELGYALPPGEYEVRVPVVFYEYPDGHFEKHAILTQPASLTVTD